MDEINKVIVHDTRDVPGKHTNVDNYLIEHGYTIVRSKLFVGDVTFLHDQHICVDLKKDTLELAMDVYQQHTRFRNECIRAQENGIQLIVLIEEELPGGNLENWKSPVYKGNGNGHKRGDPMSKVNPVNLRKVLYTMQERYHPLKFRFCPREKAGEYVLDYLEGRRK